MKMHAKLLLRPSDIVPTMPNFRVRGALNPGATRLANGKIMLFARIAETPVHGERYFLAPRFAGTKSPHIVMEKLPRSEGEWDEECFRFPNHIARLPTISHLRKVLIDKDGEEVLNISQKPDFLGRTEDGDFGVEDARITYFEREKTHAMTYVSVSMSSGVSTSLALSKDGLKHWDRMGIIFRQQNKDVVLYPEKFNGYYVAMHRPEGTMVFDQPSIWISYSKDLQFWGKDRPIMAPRDSSWDSTRIGAGTVPIKTSEGWLEIYHGVKIEQDKKGEKKTYRAGAVLFDKKNPEKIIARTGKSHALFEPEKDFEKNGFVNNVVFPTAAIPDVSGKNLLIYCGASDSSIEVRKLALSDILNSLEWR